MLDGGGDGVWEFCMVDVIVGDSLYEVDIWCDRDDICLVGCWVGVFGVVLRVLKGWFELVGRVWKIVWMVNVVVIG